jgi:hypothetical protein
LNRPDLPLLSLPLGHSRIGTFVRNHPESQPWLAGPKTPPICISDLGLEEPVTLVDYDTYLDGGSQKCVLADSKGHYFVFCTANPSVKEPPSFLLGVDHWSAKPALRVSAGSKSYQFLFDLIWSFADDPRYQIPADVIRKTLESCPDDESREFIRRRLGRKKPNLRFEVRQ